jgi:endonuclease/exonuclease/phosphatase (EEP) superfamily protein YafD
MKIYSGKKDTILISGLLFFCMLSSIRFFDKADYWLFDILSQFSVQYAFAALFFLILFLRKRNVLWMSVAGLLFIINISVLADVVKPVQAAPHSKNTFTVYSANINKSNTSYSTLNRVFMNVDADILLLLEVTQQHMDPLQPLFQTYPYKVIKLNEGSCGTGTVLMSRFPIADYKVTQYSKFGNMLVAATLEIDDKEVAFYAVHFPRPEFHQTKLPRSTQFVTLARQIQKQSVPVIVAGDFNAAPYSPMFQKMMDISGLKDSRSGYGWQPSWPTYFPPLWIPIDHVLVSPDIQVHKRSTGAYIGSDHYPVFAELSISDSFYTKNGIRKSK